jgi:hypothetical protein
VSTAKRQNTVSFITNLQAGSLSTAIWKLSFTPTVLSRGVISLKLVPEVSALDFANAVTISGTTIPALTTRRARTTVELRDGQSFAIAGLLQDDSARAQDQLPWLGSVPVLGALFRSAACQANENELVVLSDQACPAQQKAEDAFGQLACGERPQLFPERPAGSTKNTAVHVQSIRGVQSLFGGIEPGAPIPAPVPVAVAAPVPVPVPVVAASAPEPVPVTAPVPPSVPQGDGALHYDPATGYFVDPPVHGGGQ